VIAREFERVLDVPEGKTTGDREFTLETVNCLGGLCAGAHRGSKRPLFLECESAGGS
jgi:hypothetical protein